MKSKTFPQEIHFLPWRARLANKLFSYPVRSAVAEDSIL